MPHSYPKDFKVLKQLFPNNQMDKPISQATKHH